MLFEYVSFLTKFRPGNGQILSNEIVSIMGFKTGYDNIDIQLTNTVSCTNNSKIYRDGRK